MKSSKFLRLNWQDIGKGVLMAFLGALITGLYQLLNTGALFNLDSLKSVLMVALAAGISYIIKNYFTNSEGQPFKLEKK